MGKLDAHPQIDRYDYLGDDRGLRRWRVLIRSLGGPQYVADLIVGLDMPTMGILLMMMLILLFMGAFMDWVGIVLLIIPVFLPIVQRLPIEEIGLIGQLEPRYLSVWFGVLFCMNMQVSFLSPPFGPAAFYLKSVAPAHISLTDIFKAFCLLYACSFWRLQSC